MKEDPAFSRIDGVYYHLAECYARADNKAEAIPLFARVVGEHKASEFFEDGKYDLAGEGKVFDAAGFADYLAGLHPAASYGHA